MAHTPDQAVTSFAEFHACVEQLKTKRNTIFRGLRKVSYPLIPSVGRYAPFGKTKFPAMEKRILSLFREMALPFLSHRPEHDWEWLAVGQHHGLPTRMMDWTYNPLVAAFFAVEKEEESEDSVVYCFWGGRTLKDFGADPLQIKSIARYRPSHITQRIAAQSGLFTVHPNPKEPLSHGSLRRFIIRNEARREIKRTLNKYGISRRHLFPGLEGIASDLRWLETNQY